MPILLSSLVRADVILSTGFENAEGYSVGNDTIVGTNHWLGTLSAGSGRSGIDDVDTHGVQGLGNAAWLGGNTTPVTWAGNSINVRRPLVAQTPYSYDPVGKNREVVTISALVGIKDSSSDSNPVRRDNFEFFIMNGAASGSGAGDVLAALRFDNTTLTNGSPAQLMWRTESAAGSKSLSYVGTGGVFLYDTVQLLTVRVNFRTNRWSAALDGLPQFSDEVFYKGTAAVNLGAVGFRMFFGTAVSQGSNYYCAGGDNYLLFDDLTVRADSAPDTRITTLEKVPGGTATLKWNTEAGYSYQVYSSTALGAWALLSGSPMSAAQSGSLSFTDQAAAGLGRCFYKISRSLP